MQDMDALRKEIAQYRQDGADEFDLSDISHSPVEADREDIIAKAEAAAFSDE